MKKVEVLQAWRTILSGRAPSLSIEITKECPLRCPGCYAFDEAHLGGSKLLRQLSDFKGDELVTRVLAILDDLRPLHLSLVGGSAGTLSRTREINTSDRSSRHPYPDCHQRFPRDSRRMEQVQKAERSGFHRWTSAGARRTSKACDLRAHSKEHRGSPVTIHSTITAQSASRPGYLEQFLTFWSSNPAIRKIWFSLFTPQRGATDPEILSREQRFVVINELRRLRPLFPKLDMHDIVLDEIASPPSNPEECIFARTTQTISADLTTRITPCQFGGDPDCSQCGCIASMGLAAVGHYKVVGNLTAGDLFMVSDRLGKGLRKIKDSFSRAAVVSEAAPFKIL